MEVRDDLEAFCHEEFPRLVGLLTLHCKDRWLAEELAQETLARTVLQWKKVRSMQNPAAWTSTVAFNLANSFFRRKAAERRANRRSDSLRKQHVEDQGADRLAVREAISDLPARHRTALLLRYYCDLTFLEIGEAMGVPESTAKSLVRRALTRLRDGQTQNSSKEILDAI